MSRGVLPSMENQAATRQSEPDNSSTPTPSDQPWLRTVQQMSGKRLRLLQDMVRAMSEFEALETDGSSKPIKLELVLLPPGVKDFAERPAVDVIRLASIVRKFKCEVSGRCLIAGGELCDSKPCRESWFTLGIRQLGPWHVQIMCSPKLPPDWEEKRAATLEKRRLTREHNRQQQQQQPDPVPSSSTTSRKPPRTAAGAAGQALVQRALRSKRARTTSTTAAVEASVKTPERRSVRTTDGAAATTEPGAQTRRLTSDLEEQAQQQQQQHSAPLAAGPGPSRTAAAVQKMPLAPPAEDVTLSPGSRLSGHKQQPQQQQHYSATVVDLTAEEAEGETEIVRVPPRRTAPVSRVDGGVSSQGQRPPIACEPLSGCRRQTVSTAGLVPAAKRSRPTSGTRPQPRTPTAAAAGAAARQTLAAATPKAVVAKAASLEQMAAKHPRQQSATRGVSSALAAKACADAEPEEAGGATAVAPGDAAAASSDADDNVPLQVRLQRLVQARLTQAEATLQSQAAKVAETAANHPKRAAVGAAAAATAVAALPLPAAPAMAAKASLVSGAAPRPAEQTLSAGAVADAGLVGNCGDLPPGTTPGTAKGEAVAAPVGPPLDAAAAAAAAKGGGGNKRQSGTIDSPSSGMGKPVQHTTRGCTGGDAPVRDSRQDPSQKSRSARSHHRSRPRSQGRHGQAQQQSRSRCEDYHRRAQHKSKSRSQDRHRPSKQQSRSRSQTQHQRSEHQSRSRSQYCHRRAQQQSKSRSPDEHRRLEHQSRSGSRYRHQRSKQQSKSRSQDCHRRSQHKSSSRSQDQHQRSQHKSSFRPRSQGRQRHRHNDRPGSKAESTSHARSGSAGVDGDDIKLRRESRCTSRSRSVARACNHVRGGASGNQARGRDKQSCNSQQQQQQGIAMGGYQSGSISKQAIDDRVCILKNVLQRELHRLDQSWSAGRVNSCKCWNGYLGSCPYPKCKFPWSHTPEVPSQAFEETVEVYQQFDAEYINGQFEVPWERLAAEQLLNEAAHTQQQLA